MAMVRCRVAWSGAAERAVLLADDLPEAPDGMAYELWLIDESGPVPMNVLDGADGGEIRDAIVIDGDGGREPTAWGITLEPAAGSASPDRRHPVRSHGLRLRQAQTWMVRSRNGYTRFRGRGTGTGRFGRATATPD